MQIGVLGEHFAVQLWREFPWERFAVEHTERIGGDVPKEELIDEEDARIQPRSSIEMI